MANDLMRMVCLHEAGETYSRRPRRKFRATNDRDLCCYGGPQSKPRFDAFNCLADSCRWLVLLSHHAPKCRGIVTNPTVFWPATLGILFLVVGIMTFRADVAASTSRGVLRLLALGPVFVGAALAAFAGEHFTAATTLARIVPKFLPAPLFIAYLVGVAHLAAALSFVAKRYVRLSSIGLASMFALFVLLMDLPAAVTRPGVRIFWILVAREATFSIGALALFAVVTSDSRRQRSATIATIARIWAACVLVFYGIENVLFPQFSPGVPDMTPTAPWVPAPHIIAYVTGILLILCGLAMFVRTAAASATAWSGLLMTALTIAIYVPQFFVAHSAADQVTAINFIFDTLLFGGMMLIIGAAIHLPHDGPKISRVVRRAARAGQANQALVTEPIAE
jgi:uncharacterized membrane protein